LYITSLLFVSKRGDANRGLYYYLKETEMITNLPSHLCEDLIADHLAHRYGQPVFVPRGYFPFHDGTIYNFCPDVRFECKLDNWTSSSGNLAIEIGKKTGASGLTITNAHTWYHGWITDSSILTVYEFDVPRLREAIATMPWDWRGDNNSSKIVLLPLEKAKTLTTDRFKLSVPWGQLSPYHNK
jgi:hypothetical protein